MFQQNIIETLSIDETALSYDEQYTIIANKKRKVGSIVAIIKESKSEIIIEILQKKKTLKQ